MDGLRLCLTNLATLGSEFLMQDLRCLLENSSAWSSIFSPAFKCDASYKPNSPCTSVLSVDSNIMFSADELILTSLLYVYTIFSQ